MKDVNKMERDRLSIEDVINLEDTEFKNTLGTRLNHPSMLLKEMVGHTGVCKICGFVVKMFRDKKTYALNPNACLCMACGQKYHMDIPDIQAWEIQQWNQKSSDCKPA